MKNMNQCCAFDGNVRCENMASEHINHCEKHYGPAIKLYKKYKKICEEAYRLDLNKKFKTNVENIKYLLDCYRLFNQAFNARMAHRKIAFVPECYDSGHDYQFIFIKNKLIECERIICELNLREEQDKKYRNNCYNILEVEESREIVKYEPIENVTEIIMRNNKERIKIEEDIEEIMEGYRKENEKILEKRLILQNLIVKYISDILDKYNKNEYIMYIGIICIIKEVVYTGYFSEKYKPEKCCKNCGNYMSVGIVLGCKCMMNYYNFDNYLYNLDYNSLKALFRILIKYRTKYEALFCDFLRLYIIFEEQTILMNLEVIWDDNESRLIMRERCEEREKPSKYLARMRLKKKILEKQGYMDELDCDE